MNEDFYDLRINFSRLLVKVFRTPPPPHTHTFKNDVRVRVIIQYT